jgi:hypothetical protein
LKTADLLSRLKLRHKLAALGVVGMALCVLPLLQLLRWHSLELQWVLNETEQVQPAVLAVQLQRALVQHQGSAARVLRGQTEADAQRRQEQAQVDAQLLTLAHRLEPGGLLPAKIELQAMRRDWPVLVQRIVQGRCSVAESDHGHRLLIEQTLQIIDTVSAGLPAAHSPALAELRQQWLHTLPVQWRTLAAQTASTATGRAAPATQAQALQAWAAQVDEALAQWQQAQARQQTWHEGQRLLAGASLWLLAAAMLALSVSLLRRLRQPVGPAAPPPGPKGRQGLPELDGLRGPQDGRARPAPQRAPWTPPAADGQQAPQLTGRQLMQRLRGPAQARRAPPLDTPTQPQALD